VQSVPATTRAYTRVRSELLNAARLVALVGLRREKGPRTSPGVAVSGRPTAAERLSRLRP
jgi:hypothetical protein